MGPTFEKKNKHVKISLDLLASPVVTIFTRQLLEKEIFPMLPFQKGKIE